MGQTRKRISQRPTMLSGSQGSASSADGHRSGPRFMRFSLLFAALHGGSSTTFGSQECWSGSARWA